MRTCFVIGPIGKANSDTRKRSDQVLKYIIEPALPKDYEALRADRMPDPGMITSQVIQQLLDAPLVIADLSTHNPNVFYELAIRHATRKPVIHLIGKDETIPFDVSDFRAITIAIDDLEIVDRAKTDIANQLESIGDNPKPMQTPISVAKAIDLLKDSENPSEKMMGQLVEDVSSLRAEVRSMRTPDHGSRPPKVTKVGLMALDLVCSRCGRHEVLRGSTGDSHTKIMEEHGWTLIPKAGLFCQKCHLVHVLETDDD